MSKGSRTLSRSKTRGGGGGELLFFFLDSTYRVRYAGVINVHQYSRSKLYNDKKVVKIVCVCV